VVPGVTSAIAVPAAANIPVTARGFGGAFAVVTGQEGGVGGETDWSALARIPTLVVLMGVDGLAAITRRLMDHGRGADTPAAVIQSGTLDHQRTVVATLADIADVAAQASIAPPATLIVGDVVHVRRHLSEQSDAAVLALTDLPGEQHG
jgi:siroheme synthase